MNKEFGQLSNEDTAYCRSISIYQFMPNSYCSCRDFLVNTVNRKNGFIQFLNVKYGKILLSRRRQKQCFMILNLDFIYKLENPICPTLKKPTYDIKTYLIFLLLLVQYLILSSKLFSRSLYLTKIQSISAPPPGLLEGPRLPSYDNFPDMTRKIVFFTHLGPLAQYPGSTLAV